MQMCNDSLHEIPINLTKQIQECNWQVVNVTTPSNYFHVLRRQVCPTLNHVQFLFMCTKLLKSGFYLESFRRVESNRRIERFYDYLNLLPSHNYSSQKFKFIN